MTGILTVCTANVCRSAGAAVLLADLLPPSVPVGSAGVAAHDGQELCPVTRQWLTDAGIDSGTHHRSRQVTAAAVDTAELVLVASLRQRKLVLALAPQAAVFTMREAAHLSQQLTAARPRPDADVTSRLRQFTHDLTAQRHHTRFADAGRETVTVERDGGGRRWFGRAQPTTDVAISPYDVPDAHAAALHGDHSPTFATLDPAIRTVAAGLAGYLVVADAMPPTTSGDGRA